MFSFSRLFALLGAFLIALAASIPVEDEAGPVCGVKAVSVRLPLSQIDDKIDQNRRWTPPPRGFYFQPWNMIYATVPANLALRNFQYDPSPIRADGDINDLSSFQIPGNDTVYTSYGVDTRLTPGGDHLQYSGTGILEGAYSTYSLLAWGCDENKASYYVNYATKTDLTQTPAGIDIMSTSDKGIDDQTFARIQSDLKNLGNPVIAAMAANLTRTVQDGARNEWPRVTGCDVVCKSNQNLQGIIGG